MAWTNKIHNMSQNDHSAVKRGQILLQSTSAWSGGGGPFLLVSAQLKIMIKYMTKIFMSTIM